MVVCSVVLNFYFCFAASYCVFFWGGVVKLGIITMDHMFAEVFTYKTRNCY